MSMDYHNTTRRWKGLYVNGIIIEFSMLTPYSCQQEVNPLSDDYMKRWYTQKLRVSQKKTVIEERVIETELRYNIEISLIELIWTTVQEHCR